MKNSMQMLTKTPDSVLCLSKPFSSPLLSSYVWTRALFLVHAVHLKPEWEEWGKEFYECARSDSGAQSYANPPSDAKCYAQNK